MKHIIQIISFILLGGILLSSNIALGVVAYPHPIQYTLPDGSRINILLKGDEKVRWAETADGYSILLNEKGYYEYAVVSSKGDMIRSGIQVSPELKRTDAEQQLLDKVSKGIRFSQSQVSIMKQIWDIKTQEAVKAFPTTGERKLICILIGFTDLEFTKTQAEFNDLFNQIGYSVGGATGSVKDYYLENSYNQFNLTVDVAGPYTASDTMAYYGANSSGDNDIRPRELVAEAIDLADPDVNFADYDNDSDGWVDGVYVIYAGYGEEAGGGADAIWAHAWALASYVERDGVKLQRYSCSAELRGNSGTNITRIGVICHEFGHVLGAPDYYDTDYADGGQFTGTGQWDMMAGGSWNNGGATPAHHNGFTKTVVYEWAPIVTLESFSSVTLQNSSENSNSFYRIDTQTKNEYFLLENREKHKFDAYIPGSGMLIYHVHSGVFSVNNSINATYPQRMYPVSQNATTDPTDNPSSYGNINSPTCAWTGTGKNEFSDVSIPSSKSWMGVNTNKPITNISRDAVAKTVSFDFMKGLPTNFIATPVSLSQIDLSWELNIDNNPVVIAWTTNNVFGTPEDGTSYSEGNEIPGGGTVLYNGTSTSLEHTNLEASTSYYYKAWSVYDDNSYSPGTLTSAGTLCEVISSLPFTKDFNSSTSLPNCWDIIDNEGNGQVWQFGTHEEGLTGTDGNYAFLNSDDYGSLNSQNADLITPLLDLTDYTDISLSFSHYYRHYGGSEASLWYSLDGGETWIEIQKWASSTGNPSYFNQMISEVDGQAAVKFKWNYKGTWGYYWDIDDILITDKRTLSVQISGDGSVEVNGVAYSESLTFAQGEDVSLNAIAIEGYQFEGWSVDLNSTNPTETITMDTDKTITATFTQIPQYTLTLDVIGEGTVEVGGLAYSSPVSAYQDSELTLIATSSENYQFEGWSGDLVSTNSTEALVMSSNKSITATFTILSSVEPSSLSNVKLFPNPFVNNITIRNAEWANRLTITNIIGHTLVDLQLNGAKVETIDIDRLAKGIYLINIYGSNGERQIRTMVKE